MVLACLHGACTLPTADETSKKIAHAKAVVAEAQDTAARVQSRLQDMQKNVEQWQGQYAGLQGQDLGQAVLDAGRSGGPWGAVARQVGRVGCQALSIPHSLSHSVHPGEDAAAAAGQAEPPAGPWGAQCQPGPVCQHRPRAGAHCSSPRRRQ